MRAMTHGASRTFIIATAVTAATLAGIGGYALIESYRPAVLELFVFDVPGHPAIFIRTPDDRRILVNGGANSEIIERLTGILPFYSRRIDMLIATDDDPKNVTGLIDVLDRYSVDRVVLPAVSLQSLGLSSSSDPIYTTFLSAIDSRKIPVQKVAAGDRLVLDQPTNGLNQPVIANVSFPIAPGSDDPISSTTKAFQYSLASAPQIIMRVSYGTTSIVFVGGASIKVQKYIATDNSQSSDVLITSNNGNASNLAVQLIDSLAPDYLIYSQQLTKQGTVVQRSPVASDASTTSSKTKQKADPLAGILNENRFNIREKGMVKIVSDGTSIKISN